MQVYAALLLVIYRHENTQKQYKWTEIKVTTTGSLKELQPRANRNTSSKLSSESPTTIQKLFPKHRTADCYNYASQTDTCNEVVWEGCDEEAGVGGER